MNTQNCSYGFATDQIFIFNNPVGTCDMSVPVYIFFGVFLTVCKGMLAYLHIRAWRRRQRKLYAKSDRHRRRHFPIVPTLSVIGFIVYASFFSLSMANIINAANGWSYGILSIGWTCFGVMSIFFLLKVVRLGRRLIPIVQEKRRNEMLEQMQRDEDDPPTYNSTNKKRFGSFTSNPLYDEDPPTYDENSSSQAAGPLSNAAESPRDIHNSNGSTKGSLFNQRMLSSRIMFEKRVQNGRLIIGQKVQSGRNLFSKKSPNTGKGAKKVAMDPPKNPMWEEDPPTTYSILDIVEPQIDRLKKLDVMGQLFFFNSVSAVTIQFIVLFFILTFARPNDYYIAKLGLAFQSDFLFQHAVSMNWQFERAIRAVREARRKSRRNENIETGLKKLRGQQWTIFVLSSICAIIYVIQASGAVLPNWYYHVIVMFFEVLANAIIYKTFTTKLRGKINELKKQQRAKAALLTAKAGDLNAITSSPNKKNGQAPAAGPAENESQAVGDNPDDEQKPAIYKSSVAHVRESAKFATTEMSRKDAEKDENLKSSAISW